MRAVSSCVEAEPKGVVIGLGYVVPLLDLLGASGAIAFMPARQGALQWPDGASSKTALVDEDELPLANASVDLIIMLHVLENVAVPLETLNEAWRVLAPEGRLIVIAANRRGLWARFEHTPFGNGRPFSPHQLNNLLREAKLTPLAWADALHFPPFRSPKLLKLRGIIETLAKRIWPVFSGVIIVEATKRLYQGIPVMARKSKRVLVPALSSHGASRTRHGENRDGHEGKF